ncbi:MAG: MFS transporter [Actinomycetota bacterium]
MSTVTTPGRVPLYSLFGANAISMTGNSMAQVAIPWFVLLTTGSAAKTGLTAAMNFLPVVLANFFGGAFVDRLGPRRASIVADVASALPVAAIPLLHTIGGIEFWQLLILVFLGALLDAPGRTARAALLPDAVHEAAWRMERATGAFAVVDRSSRLIGAPLAGLGIAIIGAANVLWVDAASFLLSATLIAIGRHPSRAEGEPRERVGYLHEIRQGFRFVRKDRVIATMIFTATITNLFDAADGVLIPVFAKRVYGNALSLGWILGAVSAGAALGALTYSIVGHRYSRRVVFGLGFILFSLWHLFFATFPPLWLAVVIVGLSGFGAGPINPVIDTIAYERIPREMRGRVLGVMMATAWLAMPLGSLVGGLAVAALGLRTTLLIIGICYLTTTVLVTFAPGMREMEPGPRGRIEDSI